MAAPGESSTADMEEDGDDPTEHWSHSEDAAFLKAGLFFNYNIKLVQQ